MSVGEVLEGALQGQWQDRKLGQQRNHGAPKDEGIRQLRHSLLKALLEVPDQEVLEEAQPARLDSRCLERQGLVRIALLQNQLQ